MTMTERKKLLLISKVAEQIRVDQENLCRSVDPVIVASGNVGDNILQRELLNIHKKATLRAMVFEGISSTALHEEREKRWGGI